MDQKTYAKMIEDSWNEVQNNLRVGREIEYVVYENGTSYYHTGTIVKLSKRFVTVKDRITERVSRNNVVRILD